MNDKTKALNRYTKDEDMKDLYINCAKDNLYFLPVEFRKKVKRLNFFLLLTTGITSTVCLLDIFTAYPKLSSRNARNLSIWFAFFGMFLYGYSRYNYFLCEKAYYLVRSQNSNTEIKEMIKQYRDYHLAKLISHQ